MSTRDARGLAGAAGDFEALGAALLAAEAASGAAAAFSRAGDRRPATAAQHRANALAADCEGAVTPGLVRPGPSPGERPVTPEQITLVQASFARLGPDLPTLATRFYQELFGRNPALSMLAALAAVLGDSFDAPTRESWDIAYNLVAETMLEGAASARPIGNR